MLLSPPSLLPPCMTVTISLRPTSSICSEDTAKALGCHRVHRPQEAEGERSSSFRSGPVPPAGGAQAPGPSKGLLPSSCFLPGSSLSASVLAPAAPGSHSSLRLGAAVLPQCWDGSHVTQLYSSLSPLTVTAGLRGPQQCLPDSASCTSAHMQNGAPHQAHPHHLFSEAHSGQGPATSTTTPRPNTHFASFHT